MGDEIRLNALYMCTPSQTSAGLWAHPADRGVEYNKVSYWADLARLAERGLLDAIFLADPVGIPDVYEGKVDAMLKSGGTAPTNDPAMVISAMAAVTSDVAFAITGNVTFEHPFLMSRRFSTLDHLTDGRVAINVVTGGTVAGARGMGQERRPHDERYDLADEYMQALYKLWEVSWDDDAVVADREARVYVRPGSVRPVSHEAPHFKLDAVHMCEPSPQRTPVLYQAGSSTRGSRFAAEHAEAVFLVGNAKPHVGDTVARIRQQASDAGRSPNDVMVMLGSTIIVGETESEARERQAELQSYIDVEGSLAIYSTFLGVDLSTYAPDQRLTDFDSDAFKTIADLMMRHDPTKVPTLQDLIKIDNIPGKEVVIVGSPSQVAEEMIAWVDETDIDGFNLMRTAEPRGMASFIDLVVPELQARGRYKTEYRPGTFREKLFGRGPRLPDSHPATRIGRPTEGVA